MSDTPIIWVFNYIISNDCHTLQYRHQPTNTQKVNKEKEEKEKTFIKKKKNKKELSKKLLEL